MDAFIRPCHGTLSEWLEHDPILAKGEVALVATDDTKPDEYNSKKVGDGVRKFSQLPMLGFDCVQDTGTSTLFPMSQKATTEAINEKAAEIRNTDILALQQAVWPLELSFSVAPTYIKVGEATSVSLSWEARRRGRDVTAEAAIELNHTSAAGTGTQMSVTLPHGGEKELELSAAYGGMTAKRTLKVKGTLPTYFGVVGAGWTPDEATIKGLTETLNGERRLSRSGIALSNGRTVLSYPKDFGALTSAKDGNGYETLGAYTRSEVTVNDHAYYCYVLTEPVTASGITQTYS